MRLLVLGPDGTFDAGLESALTEAGYEPRLRHDPDAALVEAQASAMEGLLLDLDAFESGILGFLRRYRGSGGAGIVIVCGTAGTAALAGVALREGADGYVRKPADPNELLLALKQAEERDRLRQEVARLRATLGARGLEPLVVAEDPKTRSLLELAARAAASDDSVLITGERGTGKALLAQAMHRFSRRGDAAFVAVDCDAVPDLFTAPAAPQPGPAHPPRLLGDSQTLWRSANRGTLLLEEVVSLSLDSQAQLLTRLSGGKGNGALAKSPEHDVRVMATSRAPVEDAVGEGRFGRDLAQQLRSVVLTMPALRERPEDIPALVTHFAQQVASRTGRPVSITPQALAGLSTYAWPGNVRELRQIVERAATLSPSGKLDRGDFPVLAGEMPASSGIGGAYALKPQVEAVERDAILRALAAAKGTRRDAARLLQVSLRTLFYKLRRYGLA